MIIRKVSIDDASELNKIRTQKSVAKFLYAHIAEREKDSHEFISNLTSDDIMIVCEINNNVVGACSTHIYKRKSQCHIASLGIMVDENFHSQKVGSNLLENILEIMDNYTNVVRIELEVIKENTKAIKLYEKYGFIVEGQKKAAALADGLYHDVLLMGRVKFKGLCE